MEFFFCSIPLPITTFIPLPATYNIWKSLANYVNFAIIEFGPFQFIVLNTIIVHKKWIKEIYLDSFLEKITIFKITIIIIVIIVIKTLDIIIVKRGMVKIPFLKFNSFFFFWSVVDCLWKNARHFFYGHQCRIIANGVLNVPQK